MLSINIEKQETQQTNIKNCPISNIIEFRIENASAIFFFLGIEKNNKIDLLRTGSDQKYHFLYINKKKQRNNLSSNKLTSFFT